MQESAQARAKSEVLALVELVKMMRDCIEAAGPTGIPNGHFYAQLMAYMDLRTYERLIDLLVASGRVKLQGHVLRFVPEAQPKPGVAT